MRSLARSDRIWAPRSKPSRFVGDTAWAETARGPSSATMARSVAVSMRRMLVLERNKAEGRTFTLVIAEIPSDMKMPPGPATRRARAGCSWIRSDRPTTQQTSASPGHQPDAENADGEQRERGRFGNRQRHRHVAGGVAGASEERVVERSRQVVVSESGRQRRLIEEGDEIALVVDV